MRKSLHFVFYIFVGCEQKQTNDNIGHDPNERYGILSFFFFFNVFIVTSEVG